MGKQTFHDFLKTHTHANKSVHWNAYKAMSWTGIQGHRFLTKMNIETTGFFMIPEVAFLKKLRENSEVF